MQLSSIDCFLIKVLETFLTRLELKKLKHIKYILIHQNKQSTIGMMTIDEKDERKSNSFLN
jgi:hypothetical protein